MKIFRCQRCKEEYFEFEGVVVCQKCGEVLSTGARNTKTALGFGSLLCFLFLFFIPYQLHSQEKTEDYKAKYENLKLSVTIYLNSMSQNRQKLEKLSENLQLNSDEVMTSLTESNKLIENFKIQQIDLEKQILELQNSKDKSELDLVILEDKLENLEKLKKDSENLLSQIEERYKEEIRNQKIKTVIYTIGSFLVGVFTGIVL